DWEFCKAQPYGEPIAHGPLVLAIAGGLMCQSGINDGTIVAMLGIDAWRIHKPVKHGDTLEVVMTVTDKRRTSKGDKGIVFFKREIRNQHGQPVHSMNACNMYLCREIAAEPAPPPSSPKPPAPRANCRRQQMPHCRRWSTRFWRRL